MARRLVVASAAVVALFAMSARADAPMPPPPLTCTTDKDCPGCQRCTNGTCPGYETQQDLCMCDAECTRIGRTSCDLSKDKPLCGGTCVAAPVTQPLTCNAARDRLVLEQVSTATTENPAGAQLLPGTPIVVEVFK